MSEASQDMESPPTKKQKLHNKQQNQDDNDEKKFTLFNTKYSNYVTPEELTKLKEFKVLDEVRSHDDDSNDGDTDSSDDKSEGIPAEEIEKMLEEDLPEGYKGAPKPKEKPYVSREKIVLDEKGMNRFEVLPLDWMMVRHYSGMPVYVHRSTRVCTLSKPYFIGKGNARRHDIPITAIPCLAYRKAIEEEEKQKEIDRRIDEQIRSGKWANNIKSTETNNCNKAKADNLTHTENQNQNNINKEPDNTKSNENVSNGEIDSSEDSTKKGESKCPFSNNKMQREKQDEVNTKTVGNTNDGIKSEDTCKDPDPIPLNIQPVVLPGGIVMPPPKVETVTNSWKSQHLTHEQVNEYCKKLFSFKTVNIMLFKRWADRRKYTKARKALQYPILPEGTKLITIPDHPNAGENGEGKQMKRDWVMNMDGRSYLSAFHEYVRRALQKQPVYEFKQLENAASPYQATVYIGGMQYGVGVGTSKRQAKSAAARASIHVLIPEMKDELDALAAHHPSASAGSSHSAHPDPDFSFFDNVGIEDPRITEFCAATCEPSPHAILRTCLLRNFGDGDRHIHTEMKKLEYQKVQLTMKVGKHTSTVVCKNQKTAKQRASQAILQALHPHVRSWGSLLRLYGSRSVKSRKEKKLEEQQITLLQDKARRNEPNYAVLEKLRNEMRKLREKDDSVIPIRTLLVMDDLPTHSASNLNNVDL